MAKQKAPSFQFYYRDFIHAVRHMEKAEVADYLFLLFEQADSANGSIPVRVFEKMCETDPVREKFDEDENGFFNVRMRDILHQRAVRSKLQSERVQKRYRKPTEKLPVRSKKTENRKQKEEKEKGKPKTETEPLVYPFTDELFMNRWTVWREYKKEQFNFKYQHKGEQAALKQIGNLSNGNLKIAVAIIEQSMANGWKGLFHLDQTNGGHNDIDIEALGDHFEEKMKNRKPNR